MSKRTGATLKKEEKGGKSVGGKETSGTSEEVKLQEALRAAQEALRAADQEEVEWREEDLNDVQLLADLDRLQRDEPDADPPISQSTSSSRTGLLSQQYDDSTEAEGEAMDVDLTFETELQRLPSLLNLRIRQYLDTATSAKKTNHPQARALALTYNRLLEMKKKMEDEGDVPHLASIPPAPSLQSINPSPSHKTTSQMPLHGESGGMEMDEGDILASNVAPPSSSLANKSRGITSGREERGDEREEATESEKRGNLESGSSSSSVTSSRRVTNSSSAANSSSVANSSRETNSSSSANSFHATNSSSSANSSSTTNSIKTSSMSAEEMRVKRYEQLEGVIVNQLEEMKKAALEANSMNKKSEALAIITKRKLLLKDLELTRMGRMMEGCRVPMFHIDTIEHSREVMNEDLSAHEIEIGVIRVEDVKPASISETKLECYITMECPFPDPAKPTLLTTPTVAGGDMGSAPKATSAASTSLASSSSPSSLNPSFNYTQRLRIDRSKALIRAFQKKKIIFSLWKPKTWFLGSPTFLGKAELKLSPLLDAPDVHESLDVLDESAHKILGGKVLVSARLRFPLAKRQIIKEIQKVLVIDKHFVGLHEPVQTPSLLSSSSQPPPSLLTQSTVASLTTVHSSLTESHVSSLDTSSRDLSQDMLIDGSDAPFTTSSPISSSPPAQHPNHMDYTIPLEPTTPVASSPPAQTSSLSSPSLSSPSLSSPNHHNVDNPSTPSPATLQEKSIDFDFNSSAWMISHSVLQWRKNELEKEISTTKARIAKQPSKDEGDQLLLDQLESKKDDVDHKMTILITLVQTGNLTEEEYIRRVKVKIGEEEELLARLSAVDRLIDATLCKKRIQIMKEEIGIS